MPKVSLLKKISAMTSLAIFGAAMALGASTANASEHCKDVTIAVSNQSGEPVEVYDMKYYDFGSGKWRNEALRNRVLGVGQSWAYIKRLERVGAERTQVMIMYRTLERGRWKVKHKEYSTQRTCYRGSTFEVVLR